MTTVNISYQNIATAIAITSADGLASDGWCGSALVDNQTNKYIDALVGGSLQTGTVAAGGGYIGLHLAASWDGVDFTAGADAGDAVITWGTTGNTRVGGEFNLPLLAAISVDEAVDNLDVRFGPFSVAQVFGGIMPLEWSIIVNADGIPFHATGSANHLEYTGIEFDNA